MNNIEKPIIIPNNRLFQSYKTPYLDKLSALFFAHLKINRKPGSEISSVLVEKPRDRCKGQSDEAKHAVSPSQTELVV